MRERTRKFVTLSALALLARMLLYRSVFTIDHTQVAIVTQFGKPRRTITAAGLKLKWPWQSLLSFEKRLMVYNPRPSEFLTKDKKNIVVDSYVAWRVADPNRFLQTVNDLTGAEMR